MSKSNQSKKIGKIYGNVKVYKESKNDWVFLRPLNIGDVKYSVQATDHEGWVLCDGRSLSRSEYSDLFSIVGESFGTPDDSETFKLPNAKGRVLGGIGQGPTLTDRTLGDLEGSETKTLTLNELPVHSHTGTTAVAGSHTHTHNAQGGQGNLGLAVADGSNTTVDTDSSLGELNTWTTPSALVIDSSGSHSHSFTTGNTGLGQAFNIMQPTLFIGNVFIFANY